MKNTTLYIYEFDTRNFVLQDECAGYYVSKKTELPINRFVVNNLYVELENRNIQVIKVDNLWEIANKIKETNFNWSLCRMKNATLNLT